MSAHKVVRGKQKVQDVQLYKDELSTFGATPVNYIGGGAYADVISVKYDNDERLYAAKVIEYGTKIVESSRSHGVEQRNLNIGKSNSGIRDIYYGRMLKHPNIINAYKLLFGKSRIYLVMDLADNTLHEYLKDNILPFDRKLKLIHQLTCALQYLHQGNFVHCDLKSDNILMLGDSPLISDFGLTRFHKNKEVLKCQPPVYRAPEVNDHRPDGYDRVYPEGKSMGLDNSIASEIWSFALLCLDIIYNTPLAIMKVFKPDNSLIARQQRLHPFQYLISSLVKLDSEGLRLTGMTEYDVVTRLYGSIDDHDTAKLLQTICNKLIIINIDSRIKNFKTFLDEDIFRVNGLIACPIDQFRYNRVSTMHTDDEKFKPRLLVGPLRKLRAVGKKLGINNYCIMNTTDYIIQRHGNTSIIAPFNIEIAIAAVLWIIVNVYDYGDKTTLGKLFVEFGLFDSYNINDLHNKVLNILEIEGGYLNFDSLTSYLPANLIDKGYEAMSDVMNYIDYVNPAELSLQLIRANN